MKNRTNKPLRALSFAALFSSSFVVGQLPAQDDEEEIFELSPFQVDADNDSGYRATNSISGTRINMAIKDTPMPLEVVTRQFIEDTGATDLREALKYSSGVILQSQNDLASRGASAYQGPGGVNNAEGATANPNGVQLKLRGFVTNNSLRDGFLRQNATDSVNIERVEVVRGPAALLYGTGNFGGVVNYMVRRPSTVASSSFDVTYGTNDLMRGTFDTTGALSDDGKVAFRLSGALQSSGDHTQYFEEDHYFIAPSFVWNPSDKTEVYVDLEYGEQNLGGLGARRLRSVANVGINNDQNEHSGFYTPIGADPREVRITGPDTYFDSQSSNVMAKVTHELFDGVNFLAGYNYSTHDTQQRDIAAQLFTNLGPVALQETINLSPIEPGRASGSSNVQTGEVPNSIAQYLWNRSETDNTRNQYRVELAIQKPLFDDRSEWLRIDNQILMGFSYLKHDKSTSTWATNPNEFNYRAPNDLSPLLFSEQGDGSPTAGMFHNDMSESEAINEGQYISYLGSFLNDRLKVMAGARKDKNDTSNSNRGRNAPSEDYSSSSTVGETQNDNTNQYGVSFKLTENISLFALESEGLQPNFSGQLLPDTGKPAGASFAKSEEIGIKFDLLDGKLSGTISKYKIEKTGFVGAPWFSPVTLGNPRFDPTKDIVYNVSNWTPSQAPGGSNGGSGKLDSGAPYEAWLAGVESGAIFQSSEGNGSETWYVNASKPEGAAYLDAGFAANAADPGNWAGFLYQGETGDSLVNNATMDTMAFHGNGSGNATILQTDESKGYDAQVLFSLTENFQLLANAAITEVERKNFGQWMAYPYREDRWAVWNYDNASWGTFNYDREDIYGDPGELGVIGPATETRTGAGQLAGDDTPKYRFDFWGSYKFSDGKFKGTTVGLGGYYESKREYISGVTRGSGQNIFDTDGRPLVLYTSPRHNVDAMIRYDWRTGDDKPQHVQLNVSNLLNDRDLYGLIYSSPLSAKISYGRQF
ncbi:TonB-dependent receptor plug domain-containing protein [Pelagicoccus sp. NFK12]|uniref:TonB-dependent receptor plug domain-containing protein n=1 Tax=Pelagicoccus enzymogenes TaxID=2773457 RepID=A0A927FC81_9BACT|nr:TonB-dependent receptor plug domain-containing protein [Pelagicoccus enzymogenes]MBD5782447.1 TonB-dependent receptor plug domain-containing protein [Pelagicoccus enzymogenes]